MNMKVIYLTGAPAVGKSTLAKALVSSESPVEVFNYGREMVNHLQLRDEGRGHQTASLGDLRADVGRFVSRSDVILVNAKLINWIADRRGKAHLLIDTHQVTSDGVNLHCWPFSKQEISQLYFDQIWVLIAPEDVVTARIAAQAEGRRIPTDYMAASHNWTQISFATHYAVECNCELRVFDSSVAPSELVSSAIFELNRSQGR